MRRSLSTVALSGVLVLSLLSGCGRKPADPPAAAKAPGAAPKAAKTWPSQTLTETSVGNALAMVEAPQIKALQQKWRAAGQTDPAAMRAALMATKPTTELQTLVTKHGFASFEEWVGTLQRINQAMSKSALAESEAKLKEPAAKGFDAAKVAKAQVQLQKSIDAGAAAVGEVTDDEVKVVKAMHPSTPHPAK